MNPADKALLDECLKNYQHTLMENSEALRLVCEFRDLAREVQKSNAKLIFAGNGASASISSHISVDFSKQGGVRAANFNESNLITCLGNDYGYDAWIVEALKLYADPDDVLVLISSSGQSPNVVKAAQYAKEQGMSLVTFTGFESDNPLRVLGDISFWVDSSAYNVVECVHMIWATMAIDLLIGKLEYGVS